MFQIAVVVVIKPQGSMKISVSFSLKRYLIERRQKIKASLMDALEHVFAESSETTRNSVTDDASLISQ